MLCGICKGFFIQLVKVLTNLFKKSIILMLWIHMHNYKTLIYDVN